MALFVARHQHEAESCPAKDPQRLFQNSFGRVLPEAATGSREPSSLRPKLRRVSAIRLRSLAQRHTASACGAPVVCFSQGLCPSRGEGYARHRAPAAGSPRSSALRLCRPASLSLAAFRRVIPLPAAAHPLATPVLAEGQGFMRGFSRRTLPRRRTQMAKKEKPTSGDILFVPLNRLKKSPKNVRKVPHTKAEIEALAAIAFDNRRN